MVVVGDRMTTLTFEPLTLVAAQDADVADIVAVDAAAVSALPSPALGGPWGKPMPEIQVRKLVSTGTVFVARKGEVLLASLRLRPFVGIAEQFTPATSPYELLNMVVAPEFQRKGIGRRCLLDVNRLALRLRARTVRLDTHDGPGGAAGFYSKCEYREVARQSGKVFFERLL